MQTTGDFSKLHPAPFPIAAHCGPDGAFVDNVPLLRAVDDPAVGRIWAPRQQAALNLDLGSGYCLEVDTRHLADDLCIVAGALNKGNIQAARAILAAVGLPAFPQRLHGRLDGRAQSRLAAVLRELSLLKQNEDEPSGGETDYEQPRQPKGSPGGIGGQYAPKTGAAAESSTPVKGRLSPVVRQALKGIMKMAKRHGWEAVVPGGMIVDALLQVLTPSELDPNEEEAVKHWMAEHDYAGGKTLDEIRAHPGGEGYQEHHFLENTKENQANLPEGFRDAPENKGNIPALSHEDLHAELSGTDRNRADRTVRDALRGKPIEEQLEAMFKLMRKIGILK